MIVALDARWIIEKLSGIGVYTQELLRWLPKVAPDIRGRVLFQNEQLRDRTRMETGYADHPGWSDELVPWGLFSVGNQLSLSSWLKTRQVDVFHTTNYMMPLLGNPRGRQGKIRTVVTIHDLIPLLIPGHAPASKKARLMPVYKWLMKEIGARADRILTVSECSRQDVLTHLRIPGASADKVRTVHNGVGPQFLPGAEADRGQDLLYVGRFDPYKNVPVLIEAFARALPHLPVDVRLRIIGPPDPRYPQARNLAADKKLGNRILWDDYVSGGELVRAYQQAFAFVFPSRYEGFGLPVLEAMACGTPVITTNVSSLPEVAGDAAVLVPPDDAEALSQALISMYRDSAAWGLLQQKGRVRASQFTWEQTARETARHYGT